MSKEERLCEEVGRSNLFCKKKTMETACPPVGGLHPSGFAVTNKLKDCFTLRKS
ncbi:hypothetical protein SAMN04488104_105218 [Algoriphagus faecimaris]|uniref:Uncharacterized protein n=1 Tax=Algoriphagus faecimaris TaxID=686796 RepID=A0A1G6X7C9_9BACT|nr:hypothetical protein SAMN04488104_105218 [Algoriphagus faecimaris]